MSYLSPLFTSAFAAILLIAYPVLTLILMRRAGIRGPKLSLALLPAVCLFLGGYAFYWFMDSDIRQALSLDALMQIAIAKSLGVFIGAISWANRPASRALAVRLCDSSAYSSCRSRLIP